jgi:hypothetical protein
MELVVYLQDESDLAILESLLRRLKLRFEMRKGQIPVLEPSADSEREKNLLELRRLAALIKHSSFGDPVEWQREVRKDRILPFRED